MGASIYKFLITPNYAAPYDQRMVKGLAEGLNSIGQQTLALTTPISSKDVAKKCKEHSIDIVLQINRTRSQNVDLPKNVRYISWYQDVFPETTRGFSECFKQSDILYALGEPSVLGFNVSMPCYVGSLLSGVDLNIFNYKKLNSVEKIDFSLCGFIPAPPRCKGLFSKMKKTVEEVYRPLSGSLDIHLLEQAIRENMAPYPNKYTIVKQELIKLLFIARRLLKPNKNDHLKSLSPFESSISFYTREYPRLLDRITLIDMVLDISKSLELYGPGWQQHENYKPYLKGILSTQNDLLDVYTKSRINLANNTHGLGLHSRTLECMAVGGFILTHSSPNDTKSGGMLTSFEPDVHFGIFDTNNFTDEANKWLRNDKQRIQAGNNAMDIIKEKHCWHHRAEQIINDLAK